MIEWIFRYNDGRVINNINRQIITVGDQLLKIENEQYKTFVTSLCYFDFETNQWCPLPHQKDHLKFSAWSANSESLYRLERQHIDTRPTYDSWQRSEPKYNFWKLDIPTSTWNQELCCIAGTGTIQEFYFFNKQLYIARKNGLMEVSLEKFEKETNEFKKIADFGVYPHTYFFEFEGKLWIWTFTYRDKIAKLYYLKDDELILFHSHEWIYSTKLCLGVSNNCLHIFHSYDDNQKISTNIFNFDTEEWRNYDIKPTETLDYLFSINFVNGKIYAIYRDYHHNYIMYIGMETGSLEMQSLLKIRENYKKRLKNGEDMKELIYDIDKLIVPDKIKKDIRNSTIWKLDLTRRKLRRKLRREILKKLNDPLSAQPGEESESDTEEEIDMPNDNHIESDPTLYWNYNYTIDQPNEFRDLTQTVVVGDKIWVLNGREIGKAFQIYRFNTKTDTWKRIFFKYEEIFGDKKWENVDDTRKDNIPMTTKNYSIASCGDKIYLWSFRHYSSNELFEFDTETFEWNKLVVPADINDCYQVFGFKNELYFSQLSRKTIDLQMLDMKTNQVSTVTLDRSPLKLISKIHISGDKLFVISGEQDLFEIADGEFKPVQIIHSKLPDYAKLQKTFSNQTNIFQIWDNKNGMFLNVLDIHTLEWRIVKIEKMPSNDLYQSISAINNCLYVTRQERKKMGGGIYKLELNPSSTTQHLINLADQGASAGKIKTAYLREPKARIHPRVENSRFENSIRLAYVSFRK